MASKALRIAAIHNAALQVRRDRSGFLTRAGSRQHNGNYGKPITEIRMCTFEVETTTAT